MNRWFWLIAASIAMAACEQAGEEVLPGHDGAALRIENLSTYTISSLEVRPGAGEVQTFEDIAPGATTAYRPFEFIYSYAYLRAVVEGDTLTLQPIDYVGAQAYDSGAYTYLIQIGGTTGPASLSIEFRED